MGFGFVLAALCLRRVFDEFLQQAVKCFQHLSPSSSLLLFPHKDFHGNFSFIPVCP